MNCEGFNCKNQTSYHGSRFCRECRQKIKREREQRMRSLPYYLKTDESCKQKESRRSQGGVANQHPKSPARRAEKR